MWAPLHALIAVMTFTAIGCMDIEHHHHHAKRKAQVRTTPTPGQNLEVIIHHHRAVEREDEKGDQ